MWFQKTISLKPKSRGFHLVTDEIEAQLPKLAELEVGLAHLFIQHTSASLTINENADPTVRQDFESHINKMVPENAPCKLAGQQFDLVINGTAASLHGDLPPLPDGILASGAWCYDMMYSTDETPFNAWSRAQGAVKTMDGLGMLVEQAAESFFLWRHVRPQTAPVIVQLRSQLS